MEWARIASIFQIDDLNFSNATQSSGTHIPSNVWSIASALIDIDNDHDLDIYVINYESPNLLYINDGKGHFEEMAETYGLNLSEPFSALAAADYDKDGDIDLYLCVNRKIHRPRDSL